MEVQPLEEDKFLREWVAKAVHALLVSIVRLSEISDPEEFRATYLFQTTMESGQRFTLSMEPVINPDNTVMLQAELMGLEQLFNVTDPQQDT